MKLISKKILDKNFERWDLEVENNHNFVAEGIVIHNSNCRHAYIEETLMAGSHNIRFKEDAKNKYWHVMTDGLKEMLKTLSVNNEGMPVVAYGELFGSKVQDLHYGFENGQVSYRCFDIKVNGKYLDYDRFVTTCAKFDVSVVPVLYKGEFSIDEVMKFATSKTFVGGDNIMEGVVVTPYYERFDSKVGRVILKYVFDQYLLRKGGTEFK